MKNLYVKLKQVTDFQKPWLCVFVYDKTAHGHELFLGFYFIECCMERLAVAKIDVFGF